MMPKLEAKHVQGLGKIIAVFCNGLCLASSMHSKTLTINHCSESVHGVISLKKFCMRTKGSVFQYICHGYISQSLMILAGMSQTYKNIKKGNPKRNKKKEQQQLSF